MRSIPLLVVLVALSAACGAQTNILGRTVPAEHLDSFGNLLSTARAAYDRGELDKARTLAKRAYDLDSDSEDASVLYGFINLSLAGGDPFKLAEAMIAKEKAKKEGDEEDSTTAGTLGALKSVIGLTEGEFALMGTLDQTDPDLPLMIPRCAEDARALVTKLSYLNDAIVAVCPFVDEESRLTIDYRQNCKLHEGSRHQRPRAHFLWAFAHLTEALAFNTVLTYGTADPTGKKTNLELRVEKIRSLDTTGGVAPLLAAVQSLDATLNAVLPTSGRCSETAPTTQLRATLSDMLAVDAAFAVIPGTPDRIKTSIQKVMARIKSVQASGGSTTEAMKGDFTKKMSRSLADKLDTVGNDPAHPLSPEQKTALCGSYGTIAAGSGQASALCATP